MKTKRSHQENDLLTRCLALMMVAVLFFALTVEAFHHHDTHDPNLETSVSLVKYSPQCPICGVISHQVNTNFIEQDFHFECNPPLVFVDQPFDTYQLHFYQPTLQASKNKGPPAAFIVA